MTIVTQAWAKAHELKVSLLPSTRTGAITVAAFNGKLQPMEGTVDMDLQVGNGVELTLKRVMVMPGSHYQAILGADVWVGKSGVLGGVVAMLLSAAGAGHFMWHVMQAGVHAHMPFLPLAGGKVGAAMPHQEATSLPPAPVPTHGSAHTTPAPARGSGHTTMAPRHGPHFPTDKQLSLDNVAGTLLSPAELAMLKGLTQERQAQHEDGGHADEATFLDLIARACTAFRALPVPGTMKWLLSRTLGHYKGPYNTQTLLAKTF